jgi:CheY-like chemotaxis protein
MNVLVVDDVATNRKLLRIQLESEGISVIEASDGVEALEVLAREPVSAVISDILMPRMDGYRLCHEARKNPALRDLKLILYSGTYISTADVQLSATVGADQFIAKPASTSLILAALQITTCNRMQPPALPDEELILRQYSEVLVRKLEAKNSDLQCALEVSRCAHGRIEELNHDLERRVHERTADLVALNRKLTTALAEVKQLKECIPICSYCKNIRDDTNDWGSVETYITRHTSGSFSHGVCPACFARHIAPMLDQIDTRL